MTLALSAVLLGFVLLVWSADRLVEGAAVTAKHLGMPSLLIGMVVVGFGTSLPEMVVSAMAAVDGNSSLALGNAIGSNIVNTGMVLGVTALIAPITVHSKIVRKELPLLIFFCVVGGVLLWDGALRRAEAALLLAGFFGLMLWTIIAAYRNRHDALGAETEQELADHDMPLKTAVFWLVVGFAVLIGSSRLLVFGAVSIAQSLGVDNLIIGLTVVALGTSLPELAASVIAARKGEHDIALGNVVGSNMFNLLGVIGIAGVIQPIPLLSADVLQRDWLFMGVLTVALFLMAFGFRKEGTLTRLKGTALLLAFTVYNTYLIKSVLAGV